MLDRRSRVFWRFKNIFAARKSKLETLAEPVAYDVAWILGDFRGLSLADTAWIAALAHFSGPLIRMSLGFADPPVARHEIAPFACRARLLTFNSAPEMRQRRLFSARALCRMFIDEHPRTPAFARLLPPADTQFLQLQSSRIKDPHHVLSVQSGESIIAFSSDIVCGRRPGKS